MKGAAIGTAALGAAAMATTALADEPAESYTYADTIAWDAEYDVVVLGIGFSGMVSAMEAADAGATVLLAEKAPDGPAGGNSRVCGQIFAYGKGDVEGTKTYFNSHMTGRSVPDDVFDVMCNGYAYLADTLSDKFGFDRDGFVDWEGSIIGWIAPEYPELPGSESVTACTIHMGANDSYLYQSMRARLADNYIDKIDVWFESPGKELIQDPISKTIIGVVIERNGETRNVRALNGVCVCTGGFECDSKMLQDFTGEINFPFVGGAYNEGDGIKMCQKAGARLWHMETWEGGDLSYYVEPGTACHTLLDTTYNGAGIMVGDGGTRFINETLNPRHGHYPAGNNVWLNMFYPEHMYVVFDKTQMAAVEEAGGIDPDFIDTLTECATIAEAAEVIGCEEADLQQTIDDFNTYVDMGRDYAFGRDISTMRTFDGEAYYVLPFRQAILNTQGGPERNAEGQILDQDGDPIPNLYSAGEMGEFFACKYQAGGNVGACFIMGQIAGANAAAPKDPLPAYTLDPKVESNPAHFGDETDLVAD